MYYNDINEYIKSSSSVKEQISKIDTLIDALYDEMLNFVEKEGIDEFQLNDGQTIIRTKYRGIGQMQKTIDVLETRRNYLINSANGLGRVFGSISIDSII